MNPYSYFDQIICISLDNRYERRENATKIFHMLNIPVKYYIVSKHPNGGMYGCFQSHIEIIKQSYETGKNNILIFEDDLYPTHMYNISFIKSTIDFLKHDKSWEIFYFGYFPFRKSITSALEYHLSKRSRNNIIKYRPLATHAYCLNRKGMKKILDNYQYHIGKLQIDIFYCHIRMNSCCHIPNLFSQNMCDGGDNIASKDKIGTFFRNHQCFLTETIDAATYISLIKYRYIVLQNIIIIVVIIILVSIVYSKNRITINY